MSRLVLANLDNVDKAVLLTDLNNNQIYELQLALRLLGYKVLKLDGIVDIHLKNAFTQFKQNTFQNDYHLIGKGSVDIILKLYNDYDCIECEYKTPQQPIFVNATADVVIQDNIDWTDFKSKISKYFTVGEVTRFDPARIPTDFNIIKNILRLANELDLIRIEWGGPIGVTSWYRPPAVNRAVGGVVNSQHLTGNAVDIYPIGRPVGELQKWLDERWYGRLGWGAKKGFVHLDIANSKGFKGVEPKGIRWPY